MSEVRDAALKALHDAEAVLQAVEAEVVPDHPAAQPGTPVLGAAPAEPVKPDAPGKFYGPSVYLGHIGEDAVEGKDF